MSPTEMSLRALVKWRNFQDRHGFPIQQLVSLPDEKNCYLPNPDPLQAPESLKTALAQEAEKILKGRWTAFSRTTVQVNLPPKWFRDDWVGVDQTTDAVAFDLNHRNLDEGADIKWIWEWSRWVPIVRLVQNAYINNRSDQALTALEWLEDWVEKNPPYRGWNWTSALESGMRLIQWRWLDGWMRQIWIRDVSLSDGEKTNLLERLKVLRENIVAPHVWATWRRRSFGSSANNHLLGELTGTLLALLVYPEVQKLGISLQQVKRQWELEMVRQFSPDGGNREQALNYHLYSWEFGWQGWWALKHSGVQCSANVESILARGAFFHREMIEGDHSESWGALTWPYGDSDDALATPTLLHENRAALEWKSWMESSDESDPEDRSRNDHIDHDTKQNFQDDESLQFWYGTFPKEWRKIANPGLERLGNWVIFPDSGYAVYRDADWFLRWDLSPLGYLSMAAHGHADALHLSVWYRGVAMFVDPGTGAYYADKELRTYLASWSVHNTPTASFIRSPQRLGPFLWARHHAKPTWSSIQDSEGQVTGLRGEVQLEEGKLTRCIIKSAFDGGKIGWEVKDEWSGLKDSTNSTIDDGTAVLSHWQTPSDTVIQRISPDSMKIQRQGRCLKMHATGWQGALLDEESSPNKISHLKPFVSEQDESRIGTISPAFRRVEKGPFVRWIAPLTAGSGIIHLIPWDESNVS